MKNERGFYETMLPREIGFLSAPFHCIESCAVPISESTLFPAWKNGNRRRFGRGPDSPFHPALSC